MMKYNTEFVNKEIVDVIRVLLVAGARIGCFELLDIKDVING